VIARLQLSLTLMALAAISGAPSVNAIEACSAKSGATVPAVVELYTSEGCDSCPPADRWFSALKEQAQRGRVLPLAFHVDYWDYIGWKDRFAEPGYGTRHREIAARGGAQVVYTPQVFLDGREFQAWRRTASDRIPGVGARPAGAELRLSATPAAKAMRINVTGMAGQGGRDGMVYVALFENGLTSNVTAGENRGVRLDHDFVVRRWMGPYPFEGGKLSVAMDLAVPADIDSSHSGLAAVAYDGRGGILQALALPLRGCGG
jgi:hypothetical protein